MIRKHYLKTLATLLIAAGVQWVTLPVYATEQGEQRREARDTRQEGQPRMNAERAMTRATWNVARTSAAPSRIPVAQLGISSTDRWCGAFFSPVRGLRYSQKQRSPHGAGFDGVSIGGPG